MGQKAEGCYRIKKKEQGRENESGAGNECRAQSRPGVRGWLAGCCVSAQTEHLDKQVRSQLVDLAPRQERGANGRLPQNVPSFNNSLFNSIYPKYYTTYICFGIWTN